MDHYSTLGIRKDAPEAEIKKAYRSLSKQYHPDANPGDKEAERKFREITEAYAVLQDPEKRAAYDREGRESRESRESRTKKAGPDFEQFFGFHPKSGRMDEGMSNKNKKTKTNPLDMTDMFEQYMGIKKK